MKADNVDEIETFSHSLFYFEYNVLGGSNDLEPVRPVDGGGWALFHTSFLCIVLNGSFVDTTSHFLMLFCR